MRRVLLTVTHRILLAAWLFMFTTAPALAALVPVKSPNDHNSYRIIELKNGLQALLISNPQADMAAAAMDVATGSGDDPADRPGLAHFCEHMLFLGTRKYPQPDAYQTFISNHGGSHNAMTMFGDTNFFFDVNADSLAPALDRFAQQFTAPLFNPEYVSREKHAVASEYQSKRKLDSLRYYSAYQRALNPNHPLSHFAVGNLKTLADRPNDSVRKDLVHFYRTHYSANVMKLVVYGKQSLDDLETMVRARFSDIPNRHLTPSRFPMPLFKQGTLPRLLRVQSLKDRRVLNLVFPIPSTLKDYPIKPVEYVANLLGHEGSGSLLDVLKRNGLAQSLNAGQGEDTGSGSTFNLDISLTQKGYREWKKVVALTFDYIDKVRTQGIRKRYYDERHQMAQIGFRYHEQSEPIHLVGSLAYRLQRVEPRDVLRAPYLHTRFAPNAYQAILTRLRPDDVLISIMSPKPLQGKVQKTPWYGASYQLQPFSVEQLLKDERVGQSARELALPKANPFIPDHLGLIPGPAMSRPEHLETAPISVWYARNTAFGTPKADVYINLRSPIANASPRDSDLAQLLVQTVQDQLDSFSYPAQLAGLSYEVHRHLRGITVSVSGYDEKIHVLLEKVLSALLHPELSGDQFQIHKQQLLDALGNARHDPPYQQALSRLQELLLSNLWTEKERLRAAKDLTLEDLKDFSARFGKALQPVMLVNGNLTRASALNLTNLVEALAMKDARLVEVARSRVYSLPADSSLQYRWQVDHPDTGYVRYFQGRDSDYALRAQYLVLGQILSSPFYDSLRTRRQLGYVVFATPYPLLDVPGLGLIIESPKADGATLNKDVKAFLDGYGPRIDAMTASAFQQQKAAVISQLEEKPKQLGDLSQRYWGEIDRANFRFDSRKRLIRAIKKTRKEDIVRLYNEEILSQQRSLLVTTAAGADMSGNGKVRTLIRHRPFVP